MKLLHIDSSVLGPHSVSRQVSAAIVDRLRQATPSLDIAYRRRSTMAAETCLETEWGPSTLESIWRSFIGVTYGIDL